MVLSQVNKTLYQGEDGNLPFVVTDANANAVDISCATFTWVVWNISTGIIVTKTLGDGLILGDPKKGQVAVIFTYADTATSIPTQYVHQLEMVRLGEHTIEAAGMVSILKNLTVPQE